MNYINLKEKFDSLDSSIFNLFSESTTTIFMFLFISLFFAVLIFTVFFLIFSVIENFFEQDFCSKSKIAFTVIAIISVIAGGFIGRSAIMNDKSIKEIIVKDYAIQNIDLKYNLDLLTELELSSKEQKDGSTEFYIDAEYINNEDNTAAQVKISFADDGEPSVMTSETVNKDLINKLEK